MHFLIHSRCYPSIQHVFYALFSVPYLTPEFHALFCIGYNVFILGSTFGFLVSMFLILVETVVLLQFLLFAIFAISRCFSSLMVIVNFFFLMLCFCSTCLIFPLSFAAPFSFLSSMLKYLLHIFYLHLGSFLFTGFFSFNTIFLAT